MAMSRIGVVSGVVLAVCGTAFGQSFNIDFTRNGDAPSDAYAGAGVAGHWNAVDPPNFGATVQLSGLDGVPSGVTIVNLGGAELPTFLGPIADEGGDRSLLNDCLITRTASVESCIFFAGLEAGTYEVIIYAWMPEQAGIASLATVDEAPGSDQLVGGAWSGAHELGTTYSRHLAEVGSDGRLRTHSGIAPGADESLGAAMNGIQIRLLAACPGDFDEDGSVGSSDLAVLLASWGASPFGPVDLDANGVVGSGDLAILLASWGACAG